VLRVTPDSVGLLTVDVAVAEFSDLKFRIA